MKNKYPEIFWTMDEKYLLRNYPRLKQEVDRTNNLLIKLLILAVVVLVILIINICLGI